MYENRAGGTRRDVTARFRGYQRADKMHMLVRTRRTHSRRERTCRDEQRAKGGGGVADVTSMRNES